MERRERRGRRDDGRRGSDRRDEQPATAYRPRTTRREEKPERLAFEPDEPVNEFDRYSRRREELRREEQRSMRDRSSRSSYRPRTMPGDMGYSPERADTTIERDPIAESEREDRPRRDFRDRDDRRGYGDREDRPRRDFRGRDDRRGYGDREDRPRRDFRGRDDRRGYGDREDRPRRDFRDRDDRRGYGDREDRPRRDFRGRDDRRGYGDREDRPRRDFRGRDDRRGYGDREDRPRRDFRGRDDRRGYGDREDRPRRDFRGRDDRRGYGDREDRPRRDFRGRDDRRGYGDREDRPRRSTFGASRRIQEDRAREERASAREAKPFDPNEPMRLNRFIAHCGISSRRDADFIIQKGEVTVDGEVVTTLGEKIVPATQEVCVRGEKLSLEKKVYILLNKPKDCFSTNEDPHADHTVLDIIDGACSERVYPVGRLDRNSTGLLLLTNDGELTEQLLHPSHEKVKIYEVTLDKDVSEDVMRQLLEGIELEEGLVKVDQIDYSRPGQRDVVGLEIHTGQNRVVRRLFDALGFRVNKLDRVYYAGLTKKNLPRGEWRFLTDSEVSMLKSGRYQ